MNCLECNINKLVSKDKGKAYLCRNCDRVKEPDVVKGE
ncbi:hypothetical protein LCGC14_0434700 [marine sediment metagenome]|uniref:Uncharacterized protein n=1 Tax=marine sediment metagenome TaxID=412755 RepID=A0A0F9VWA1_9ZZZZ